MDGDAPTYLDTSGVLAFLNADDHCHKRAVEAWRDALSLGSGFAMTDYVRLETWSLLQRRLGIDAVTDFYRRILPLCEIHPVGENGFPLLAHQVLTANRRRLSLVDLSSFECMRQSGLQRALAFNRHFEEMGFTTPDSSEWD